MPKKIKSTGLLLDDNLQEIFNTYDEKSLAMYFFQDRLQEYPHNTIQTHWHHMLELTMVTTGKGVIYINGHPHEINAGECVFLNSRALHKMSSAYNNVETTIFGIWFSPSFLASNMESAIYKKYFKYFQGNELDGMVISPFTESGAKLIGLVYEACRLYQQQDSFGYELSCLSLIAQLWKALLEYLQMERNYSLEPKAVHHSNDISNLPRRMLSYIHEHYAEKLTIDLIAKELYYSRGECFKLFKEFTGQTPTDYINNYRIEQAETLLMNSTKSITEISILCGFSSLGYMTKLFKKKHCMTPTEYRKQLK